MDEKAFERDIPEISYSDFEDSGSEYQPDDESSSSDEVETLLDDVPSENVTDELTSEQDTENSSSSARKSKKRLRNEKKWKRNERKLKRAKGEEYKNSKGNLVQAKKPKLCPCTCPNKCHSEISSEQQMKLFKSYYDLADFNLQSAYLFSLIKVVNKSRTFTSNENSRRQKTRHYYLQNSRGEEVKVCKKFFENTLCVSDGRISRLLKNKHTICTPPLDKRGKSVPKNKTPEEKITEIKNFITRFPSYESHYTLHKTENRRYLAPDLSINIMYSFYKEQIDSPTSKFIFTKVFNENFNLSFHPPISDSCKRCDSFDVKLKACDDETSKSQITLDKKFHLTKVESARNGFRADAVLAKENKETLCVITFDLMKTLPTPVISTGICYYKRQLWTYCLGVHNMGTDEVFMFVWDETVASRGPQEIGSCLLYFIKKFVKCKKLVMYSDQCGGQNRNIKLALLCQYIVSNPEYTVEEIDHKFLVSGHSYLPCDQDFGLVQKQKKYFNNIFVPKDWEQVILAARKKNPFKVIRMSKELMYSTRKLELNITNRKLSTEKTKVEWLKMQWLQFRKEKSFNIFYKYSNNTDVYFYEVDLRKRNSVLITELDILYPNGNAISEKKKKDLLELIDYIPPILHDFYKNIKTSSLIQDDKIEVPIDLSNDE